MTSLFISILNMSITASYVALVVIVIRLFLKKVPKVFSYVLWLPVLIRLVFPFSFSSSFSFFSFLGFSTHQTNERALEYVPGNIGYMQNPIVDVGINTINNAVNKILPAATPASSANPIQIIIGIASYIWVIGMIALFIYSVVSYLKVINNVKTATLVHDNIFETDRITTPFVCGFIKPKIFIPAGIDENELTYILKHEQTHIKRLDYLMKPIAFLALILHWFNPLMWISFALMSKDMEMSCDESVVKKLGDDIKESYSNSLLSLSVKRSGLLMGSPLAFGESNTKSRIKNILTYKKPAFWVVAAAIIITAVLILAFTANPKIGSSAIAFFKRGQTTVELSNDEQTTLKLSKGEQSPASTISSGYDYNFLVNNKTQYVGNNGKVVALIDALPLPEGIVRDTVELQTENKPYGITINLVLNDAHNIIKSGAISTQDFHRNSILLFSLIDNVDIIEFHLRDNTGDYKGATYGYNYTREMTEKLMGGDVRPYADSADTLAKLVDKVNGLSFYEPQSKEEKIEAYIEAIMSSPKTSSSPQAYIKAHSTEYGSILLMGDEALHYLLAQFGKRSNNNDLRGHIMMALCKDLLGDRNNVTDENLSPQEWYSKLAIKI